MTNSDTGYLGTAKECLEEALEDAAGRIGPVSLSELDQALLHDRMESKVILRTDAVPTALAALADDYLVLDHAGQRLQGYRTLYFDSQELRNYHEHHNQKRDRLKLRYRTYLNSDPQITYFEVKRNDRGRTVKERRRSRPATDRLWGEDAAFFEERTGWPASEMRPSLCVAYRRILLVKKDMTERVTIDLGLRFESHSTGGAAEVLDLAICEFKQPRTDRTSPALQVMAAMQRRPQMFSKYCMGLAACDPKLRRNRFKKVFRDLEDLDVMPNFYSLAVSA